MSDSNRRSDHDSIIAILHRCPARSGSPGRGTILILRGDGPYALQVAISAAHAEARSLEATDWHQICAVCAALLSLQPSPVIELNVAAAVAMHKGPEAGLALVDGFFARGELLDYHLAHSARADLLRRLGRADEAKAAYQRALALAKAVPDRRFLELRLRAFG